VIGAKSFWRSGKSLAAQGRRVDHVGPVHMTQKASSSDWFEARRRFLKGPRRVQNEPMA
jgi:hypothetical protein